MLSIQSECSVRLLNGCKSVVSHMIISPREAEARSVPSGFHSALQTSFVWSVSEVCGRQPLVSQIKIPSSPAEWYDRYSRRFEDYRLPKSRADRYALAEQIGRDGMLLWEQLGRQPELMHLRELPALEILRQVWVQQFMLQEEHLKWRTADDLPPASLLIQSPYDAEARFSQKRQTA